MQEAEVIESVSKTSMVNSWYGQPISSEKFDLYIHDIYPELPRL